MKRYFIDTNILMYAQGAEHKYRASCQVILRYIAADELYGATNTEVLQEILYRYASLGKKGLGIQMVENALAILHEVLPVERGEIFLALGLLKRYPALNVRDAIHASSALIKDFRYVLSVDKHFDKIKGLQRVDPLEI